MATENRLKIMVHKISTNFYNCYEVLSFMCIVFDTFDLILHYIKLPNIALHHYIALNHIKSIIYVNTTLGALTQRAISIPSLDL